MTHDLNRLFCSIEACSPYPLREPNGKTEKKHISRSTFASHPTSHCSKFVYAGPWCWDVEDCNRLPDIKFAPVGLGHEEIDSLWKSKLCPLLGGAEVEPAEKKPKTITKMSGVWILGRFCNHLKIKWSKPAQWTASGKQLKHEQGSSLTKGPLEIN